MKPLKISKKTDRLGRDGVESMMILQLKKQQSEL